MSEGSAEQLLHRLGTAEAGLAWKEFLHAHSGLLLGVARQFVRDRQSLHDCFLFICEKLVDDDFRRLRAWHRKEHVRFSTWLRAVAANLCVDWHRAEFGRPRPFRSIADLPELERLVYTHRFEFGGSFRECFEAVAIRYPSLSELELAAIIRRINRILTPQQHWALATRKHVALSFDEPDVQREAEMVVDRVETPEQAALGGERHARLQAALGRLSPHQRLLLKLRYQQGLSLREVASLAGYDDLFKARYQVRLALEQLQALLAD